MRVALRRNTEVDDQILYPADDGVPMEDLKHVTNAVVLQTTLADHLRALGRDAFVAVNNFIYYRRGDPKACVGPDFYVILDAKEDPERDCWRAWNEDPTLLPPQVVVEFVSKSSGYRDRVKKFAIYRDTLRVPNYVICNNRRFRLDAFTLQDGEYVAVPPGPHGRFRCDAIGLNIGFHEKLLRWFKADGTLLATAEELRDAAEASRDAAEARRDAAEARLDAVEAELARLRRVLEERGLNP